MTDDTKGGNYYPQKFPNGKWDVVSLRKGTNKFEGDAVLKTDAHQTVDIYSKKTDKETGAVSWEKSGTQEDHGYNLHSGKDDYSDWTKVTEGCIRVSPDTIKELVDVYKKCMASGGGMTLEVQD